ncbi:MAG: tripartite tricarboxylate transporter TctB family protein [Pseudomonadota bacterium]
MQQLIKKYNKDYYGGALMVLCGLGIVAEARHYQIGTLSNMGPGFFPVALGLMLALIGVLIAVTGQGAQQAGAHHGGKDEDLPPEWRGWTCISLSIVAFIALGKYGGLVPASFAVVFISAMGDRQNTVKAAAILALVMTAISVAVFWWGLHMQFPLFQWG